MNTDRVFLVLVPAIRDPVAVSLWPALATGSSLNKEFTRDNLHLLAPGYRAWAGVLRPHLAEFTTKP